MKKTCQRALSPAILPPKKHINPLANLYLGNVTVCHCVAYNITFNIISDALVLL